MLIPASTTAIPWRALLAILCAWAMLAVGPESAAQTQRGSYSGAVETELPAWFKESFLEFEEDIAEAAAEGKRLVLYFHQDGCPYCNLLIEHNFTQKDIYDTLRQHFDVIALNMWGDREVVQVGGREFTEKTLAQALGVRYTPTLIFFDENGKIVLRLNGYYPPERLRVALEYVASHAENDVPYVEYAARHEPKPATGRMHGEPFFGEPPYDLGPGARGDDRLLAVYFEQPQCSFCDDLHGTALADPATRALAEQFESVQLGLWSDTPVITPDGKRTTAREWAKSLGIHFAPSIVFFDASGREVMRSDAFLKTFHLQSVFAYVLERAYDVEPSFQTYLSARADRLRDQGIDVDLWR